MQRVDHIDRAGFRANVGIVLSDRDRRVLIGGRVKQPGWQFPQGGIRSDETPEQAMFRELEEEIGLRAVDVEVLGSTRRWLRYRLPDQFVRRHVQPVCVGQKQRWFLLRLIGSERRLRLDTTATPEFDRWRWVAYWEPVREVIYFKRRVYARALHELAPLLFADQIPPRPNWWSRAWEPASQV